MLAKRVAPVLSVTFLGTVGALTSMAACGGGGSSTPDASYANECGPVLEDAGMPNTLLNAINAPTTLKKECSPYYFTGNVTVAADLTIEAGVKLIGPQGGRRSRITVNRNGRILATGTANDPIIFTSLYADSGGALGGQWTGLLFLESKPNSHLEHVIIEYAGAVYMRMAGDDEFNVYEFPKDGSLLNDSTPDLEVVDVWIRHGNGYAIASTTSDLFDTDGKNIYNVFDRVTFTQNLLGAWLPVDQIGGLGPDLCWAERDAMGLCPAGGTPPAGNFIEVHVDNTFGRTPENITKDATWKPYLPPYVVDSINVTKGALLEILDGVELRMTQAGGISVGINDPGALKMIGTPARGIKVTSSFANPTDAQHHNGIVLWSMTDSARTHIEGVEVGYGGKRSPLASEAAADIVIFNNDATVIGNHVHHSLGAGIHWSCAADPKGLEDPPLPSTNTSDDATIKCALSPPPPAGTGIGVGIAENFGCDCPMGGCQTRCPPSGF